MHDAMMDEMMLFANVIGVLGFMLAQICRKFQQRQLVFLQMRRQRVRRLMAYLRRRRAQHMWRTNALAAAAIAAVINEQRYRDSPRRFRSRPRSRGVWEKLKFTFGNEDWKEHFRMTKATFTWLCRV